MDNLESLKADIFARQKNLAGIYSKYGKSNLLSYVDSWMVAKPSAAGAIFLEQLKKHLAQIYPAATAGGAAAQFAQTPMVSSIDHHGILNHPFFVNSNLIFSQRRNFGYLLCLSTASVSLNNSSWPGCLLVTGIDGQMHRFSFFPDKKKIQPVLALKGLGHNDIERIRLQVQSATFLAEPEKRKLLGLVKEVFQNENFYACGNFCRQASYASAKLWERVFPDAPKLLYLPLETVVSSVIVDVIAADKTHVLYKLFFTSTGWDLIEHFFQGALGAFSGVHKGSFLFWGIDGNGKRVRLMRQKNFLIPDDFAINADPISVTKNLQDHKIYPTSLVCFLVLLYYGVTCLGGFNQVNWLTGIKEKFLALLQAEGKDGLASRILGVPTENFAEGNLAFGLRPQGQIYKPSLLDLFLQDDPGLFKKYCRLASLITVEESINTQLPEIYKVITPFQDRDSKLVGVTEGEILNYNDMTNKIKSVFGT